MRKFVLTAFTIASLGLVGTAAYAQDGHTGHSHEAAAPTMEQCMSMHSDMMDGVDRNDASARQAAMEAMSDEARARMMQCHDMMTQAHGENHEGGHDMTADHHAEQAQQHGDGGHQH